MSVKDLKAILDETGYPVAYGGFDVVEGGSVPTPYISFRAPGTNNVFADNRTHAVFDKVKIELCTLKKEPDTEKKLTDILDAHGIPWQQTGEDFIEQDGVFSIIYETEIKR